LALMILRPIFHGFNRNMRQPPGARKGSLA
jgi:hypothetical protein